MWIPEFPRSEKPLYLAIAECIGEALRSGALRSGERLPTQREIARALGITIGTANRAYVEARRRGFVESRVGSGTFAKAGAQAASSGRITQEMKVALTETLERLAKSSDLANELMQLRWASHGHVEESGTKWLRRVGIETVVERVMSFSGAQHALSSAFAGLLSPGDVVICESLTYPGIAALATVHGLKLAPAAIDEEGILPEAVEEICARHAAKALYLVPTLQMPTLAIMGQDRRTEIARIARKHDLLLIEDDACSALMDPPPAPIALSAPERTIFVSDVAHTLCPALRLAFVVAPPHLMQGIEQGRRATLIAVPALECLVIADWIREGADQRLITSRRVDLARRAQVAQRSLSGSESAIHPSAPYCWLNLPKGHRPATFVESAKSFGIEAYSSDAYIVDKGVEAHAVCISLCSTSDFEALESGLRGIASLAAKPPRIDVPPFNYG